MKCSFYCNFLIHGKINYGLLLTSFLNFHKNILQLVDLSNLIDKDIAKKFKIVALSLKKNIFYFFKTLFSNNLGP